LVQEGHRAMTGREEAGAAHRRDAVARTSGVLTGVYGPDYLSRLRADWPE